MSEKERERERETCGHTSIVYKKSQKSFDLLPITTSISSLASSVFFDDC